MKTITTKIPNKEHKDNYALIHVSTYNALISYLNNLSDWVKEDGLEDWKSEVHNELKSLRKI